MKIYNKEVFFNEYCENCKYWEKAEEDYPCSVCLNVHTRSETHRPLYFDEATSQKKQAL